MMQTENRWEPFNGHYREWTVDQGSGLWIIGYGNPHCRDDGIGPYIAGRLQSVLTGHWEVNIQCSLYLDTSLIDDLINAEKVIFIDATTEQLLFGWKWQPILPQMGPWPWTVHDFSAAQLLAMMNAYFGCCPEAWMISVQGEDFNMGEGLSQAAQYRSETVVKEIDDFLKNLDKKEKIIQRSF